MKPLNFGIIGLRFGSNYIRALHGIKGVGLKAVASRSHESYQKIQNLNHADVVHYRKAEDLIARPDIDCIVIASPPSTHFSYIRLALKHEKHVLVEKPAVIDIKEAKELYSLVQASRVCFMVGHLYLYNDHIRRIKQYIDNGRLGTISYVYFEISVFGPIRSDVECLWEIGSHHLSLLDYLFEGLQISDVRGMSAAIAGRKGGDYVSIELLCSRGIVVHLVLSWFFPMKRKRLVIAGTRGIADYDDMAPNNKLAIYRKSYPARFSQSSYYFHNKGSVEPFIPSVTANDPLRNELQHFISCIKKNKEPLSGNEECFRVAQLLDFIARQIVYSPGSKFLNKKKPSITQGSDRR